MEPKICPDTGNTLPHDHDEIAADDVLIRRVNEGEHVVYDDNLGSRRLSSKLFRCSTRGSKSWSVDHERLIQSDGLDPREFVTVDRYIGSVSVSGERLRSCNTIVGYEPVPGNPYHCGVWPANRQKSRFTRGQRNDIWRAVSWYVEIPNVLLGAPPVA